MRTQVHYNDKHVDLTLPDDIRVEVFDLPSRRLPVIDPTHWINSHDVPEQLRRFLRQANRLLVVVNDSYRPTPTARILRALKDELDLESSRFLIATGLHPVATAAVPGVLFGELANSIAKNLHVHDAQVESELAVFGEPGAQVRLNKLFAWCDSIMIIGSVEPHYFAGFTGGRKIVLPGCASFADIEENHAYAVEAGSQPLRRDNNPVWEDIQRRTGVLDSKPRYAIQVVCDHSQNIFFASDGDWDLSYNVACEFVLDNYARGVPDTFDIIVSVVYPPLDRNLYQLQKSYENVAGAVKDGGTILLLSSCRDGVGDDRFLKIAAAFAQGEEVSRVADEELLMGIHKVKRTIALARRIDLVLCSTLDGSLLRDLPITARSDVQTTLNELVIKYGSNCKIAVVLDAASQVLYHRAA